MAFSCKPSSDKNTCIAVRYESCSYDIHILCDCEPARTTIARDVFKTKPKFLAIAFTERDYGFKAVCVLAGEDAVL